MRLYSGDDYLDIELATPPVYTETKTVQRDHIPYSDKENVIDMGRSREVTLTINAHTDDERNDILAFLDKVDKISPDNAVFYKATHVSGNETGFFFLPWHVIQADFLLSVKKYSLIEKTRAGGDTLDNSGNYYAEPTFEITLTSNVDGFTISDGIRTLTVNGSYINGDVVKISNWQLLLNGEDLTNQLSGNYVRIPENQSSFVMTFTNVTLSDITIKYRDTWR